MSALSRLLLDVSMALLYSGTGAGQHPGSLLCTSHLLADTEEAERMKVSNADPPCWGHHSDSGRSRPPRGEQSWSLSKSVCELSRVQGDDESTAQGRWHVGNIFEGLDQAEQAYDKSKAVWLPVHQDPA